VLPLLVVLSFCLRYTSCVLIFCVKVDPCLSFPGHTRQSASRVGAGVHSDRRCPARTVSARVRSPASFPFDRQSQLAACPGELQPTRDRKLLLAGGGHETCCQRARATELSQGLARCFPRRRHHTSLLHIHTLRRWMENWPAVGADTMWRQTMTINKQPVPSRLGAVLLQ